MRTLSVFCYLLYVSAATSTEGAEINVEGFEGGEVSFQCSHKLAWQNNKYLCKDLCKKSDDILVTVKSGGRAASGRITLVDSRDGAFTVTFSQLQLSDSQEYWCAVDRPGFDTYTSVHLTVKEAVEKETTVIPVSPPWTYLNITNSTQLTSGINTSRPTNLSTYSQIPNLTASNFTNGGEQNISTGTTLYATIGGIALLIILMLAMRFRKCREITKPQPRVCPNSTGLSNAHETEVDCEYDDIDNTVKSFKTVSASTSATARHPRQAPPTSTAAEGSLALQVYENVSFSRGTPGLRYSPADDENNHDITSGIYIKPLPPIISERTGDGLNKPTTCKNTGSCASNASPCLSRSTEEQPRTRWFGLDISGIDQRYPL